MRGNSQVEVRFSALILVPVLVLLFPSVGLGQESPRSSTDAITFLKMLVDEKSDTTRPDDSTFTRTVSHTPLEDIDVHGDVRDFRTFRLNEDRYGVAILFHTGGDDYLFYWVINGETGDIEDRIYLDHGSGGGSITDLNVSETPTGPTDEIYGYVTWVRTTESERDLLVFVKVSKDGVVWSRGVTADSIPVDHFYYPSIAVTPGSYKGIVVTSPTLCSGEMCPSCEWYSIPFWEDTGQPTGHLGRVWHDSPFDFFQTSAVFNAGRSGFVVTVKRESASRYALINFNVDWDGIIRDYIGVKFEEARLGALAEPTFLKSEYNHKGGNDTETMSLMTNAGLYWIGSDMDCMPGDVANPYRSPWLTALAEDWTWTENIAKTVSPFYAYTGERWTWSALVASWHKEPEHPALNSVIYDFLPWEATSGKGRSDQELLVAGIRYSPDMSWPPRVVTVTILDE